MNDVVRCPMSDLPVDQCALPCHAGVDLPAGVAPEVRRGVEPSGRVTVLTLPADQQHEARDTRLRARRARALVKCRYDVDLEQWVTPEHVRDCNSNHCRGCKPCPEDHCEVAGCPNHVQHDADIWTCASTIGECRDIIGEIEQLAALVDTELEHSAFGSEVVNLAGPFADPLQRSARRRFDDTRGWCDYPRPDWYVVDRAHPAAVFARWEIRLRAMYGQAPADPTPQVWPLPHLEERRPLSRSADYFRWMLSTGMPHTDVFVEFFTDMRRLRTHLEEVLSDSRRPEQGAPCPVCAVELKLAREDRKAPRLERRHSHWCDNSECTREHDKTGAKDKWVCPANGAHEWTEAEYRLRVGGEYKAHAGELPARELAERLGVPPSTVRSWIAPTRHVTRAEGVTFGEPKLKPVGSINGRKTYSVREAMMLAEKRGAG